MEGKHTATPWASDRAKTILEDAKREYGRGWEKLSEDQQQNFLHTRVLLLILGQAGEQFLPAQEMARDVFDALSRATGS